METLRSTLEKALAGAAEIKAFTTIQNQPPARSLVGLLIAQGQSFTRAQRARRHLFEYLDEQKVDSFSDQAVWTAVVAIPTQQWEEWRVPNSVRQAIAALEKRLQTDPASSLTDIMRSSETKQSRIGPWTRKAFLIMTASDKPEENKEPEVLLTEDSWVRQRWGLILHHLKLAPRVYPLSLETCRELGFHPIDLSRLLWRLTKDGALLVVVQKKTKNPIDQQASEWFIPLKA